MSHYLDGSDILGCPSPTAVGVEDRPWWGEVLVQGSGYAVGMIMVALISLLIGANIGRRK